MAQRTLKHVLAGGALLAALTLTSPTPAQAAGLSAESFWSWLSGLWGGPTASVRTEGRHAGSRHPEQREKAAGSIDLNSCTGAQTTGVSGSCSAGSDIGFGIDPNG